MPFSFKSINKKTLFINNNDIAGFEYPEVFVMLITAVIICVSLGFTLSSTLLLLGVLSTFLVVIFLSYRNSHNSISDLSTIALMAIVLGFTKFSEPVLISVLLLGGIRFIICDADSRVAMSITLVLMTAVTTLTSIILGIPNIELIKPYAMTIIISSLLIAWWQFWSINSLALQYMNQVQKSKRRLNTLISVISKLARFMPPQVWKPIVKSDLPVNVFNKRAKLTILFSDIVGFTELSDTLSADNLAEILNTYMDSMTIIANRHGAVLDKFIGDGMMCFFGEPTSNGVRDGALDCVAMAVDMRREMRVLRHQWRLQGFEGLYIRIGIHTGYCHVGNFGSNNRLNYTLIGRSVNLTSRLESAASKGSILISQDTYDYVCHDYTCTPKGVLELKGFDAPVLTYQVLDPEEGEVKNSKWIDQDLPGFNLQLNFKDIKNYDYRTIKGYLNLALEQVEKAEDEIELEVKK